jgi:hypothetical protein
LVVLRQAQRMRSVSPAVTPGRLRRTAAPAAWLLVLALAVAGCAALGAALRTGSALQGDGYQNVNVNVTTGSDIPAGGLVTVSYSSGPAGNRQRDAQRAEQIVWNTFPGHFGALAIDKEVGGCAGPVCATESVEVASATYAQLAAGFGPRPHGLDKASATLPGWAVAVGLGLAVAVIAAAATVVALVVKRRKRKRNRPPGALPGWPSGTPYRVP